MSKQSYKDKYFEKKASNADASVNIDKFTAEITGSYEKNIKSRKKEISELETTTAEEIVEMESILSEKTLEIREEIKEINEAIDEYAFSYEPDDIKTVDKRKALAVKFTQELAEKIKKIENLDAKLLDLDKTTLEKIEEKRKKSNEKLSSLNKQVVLLERLSNLFS